MESDTEITDIMPACISFGLDEACRVEIDRSVSRNVPKSRSGNSLYRIIRQGIFSSFMFSFSLFLDLYLTWCKDISF